ncbi:MAG: hypothetical protein DME19_10910, partial [Verrucomicrobia bacterium]
VRAERLIVDAGIGESMFLTSSAGQADFRESGAGVQGLEANVEGKPAPTTQALWRILIFLENVTMLSASGKCAFKRT